KTTTLPQVVYCPPRGWPSFGRPAKSQGELRLLPNWIEPPELSAGFARNLIEPRRADIAEPRQARLVAVQGTQRCRAGLSNRGSRPPAILPTDFWSKALLNKPALQGGCARLRFPPASRGLSVS